MSDLTKQQLRNELVSHGVKPPSPSAKKSEYVKIYEKYVAPVAQSRGDFSSDDEDLLPENDTNTKQKMSLDSSSMVINGLDISHLDDDELYSRLQELGSPVGPIVDTTRTVYQKKLFVLLGGQVSDAPAYNGTVDQEEEEEEEYSDNEPEVAAPERSHRLINQSTHSVRTYSTKAASTNIPSTSSHFSETRQRVVPRAGETSLNDSSLVYDHDLHTPSPRRSLRTVTSSESSTYRRIVNNGKTSTRFATSDGHDAVDSTSSSSSSGKLSSLLRVLVKLLFLALIIAVALYYYQNHQPESPFKSIEEMARQALEAASGEEVTLPPKDTDQQPPPQQQQQVNN